MLESVAVHFQVIAWPLSGAAAILVLNRFLPKWLRRAVALTATVITLVSLWNLTADESAAVEILWDPLNFFRLSPTLLPDHTTRLFGTILIAFTAAVVLGIRGSRPRRSLWHSLILVALSGCLVMTMPGNLLTLTLGSAMLDLALLAIVVSTAKEHGRLAWRTAVPGMFATLLLFVASLQMDIEIGTTSLRAAHIPVHVLMLVAVAGLLHLMVLPLQPRGLNTPEDAALLILRTVVGIYLLYRVQAHALTLGDQQWIMVIGCLSLLLGGALAWVPRGASPAASAGLGKGDELSEESRGIGESGLEGQNAPTLAAFWSGVAAHQTALALMYVVLLGAAVPWPLINLAIALAIITIWWDCQAGAQASASFGSLAPAKRWVGRWLARAGDSLSGRLNVTGSWRAIRLTRYWTVLPPVVALASLVGLPVTAGTLGRWRLYATLLNDGRAVVLLCTLVADIVVCAGLWRGLGLVLEATRSRRPRAAALLAMTGLAIFSVALGILPTRLVSDLGTAAVRSTRSMDVSVWGVGLLFVLPWLLGSWLARARVLAGSRHLRNVRNIISLDWAFTASSWIAQRLANLIHWLGQVGEGEGWWGWALIVLALGSMFLANL